MSSKSAHEHSDADIESVSLEILDALAQRFPVCMSSDEFHFFPQAVARRRDWSKWDRFSNGDVVDALAAISQWTESLRQTATTPSATRDAQTEASLMLQILATIRQQLAEVEFHKTQPTFYLTVASIGLAEALENTPTAFRSRVAGLPDFIDQAIENLRCIPTLFRDLGLEMVAAMEGWLLGFQRAEAALGPAMKSLRRLEAHLNTVETRNRFQPEPELYARIACYNMDCRLPLEEIGEELLREIMEAETALKQEAKNIERNAAWQEVLSRLPGPAMPAGGHRRLYQEQIAALGQHCRDLGVLAGQLFQSCPVAVEPIPESLRPVRSAAAYSMPPGHPPSGGTFYISGLPHSTPPPTDYRLLTAHETYPGHHLLDSCRWSHKRRVRRHIEYPIFYEGWASFSEEILFDTGFFRGPAERFLLAKRRYWRAVRGLVDLELNSGHATLEEATDLLTSRGMNRRRASAMVRRYALKPGYQLCYTIGRRKFRRLYDKFTGDGNTPADFVRRVLAEGEIGLENLEKILLATPVGPGGQQ